jgi:uncharacterized DUF497 family protein
MKFDWDERNRAHCQKHGVSIAEIEDMFNRRDGFVMPAHKHSEKEQRFVAIGTTTQGRTIFVPFTLTMPGDELLIRPIGARYMHDKEIRHYEKERAKKTSDPAQ